MPRSSDTHQESSTSAKRRLDFDGTSRRNNDDNNFAPSNPAKDHVQQLQQQIDESTPQKKKKTSRVDSYFSPTSRLPSTVSAAAAVPVVVVTPEKVEATSPANDYHQKKTKKAKKIVFNDDDDDDDYDEEAAYVPTYIHKNLDYQRRGHASLSPNVQKTFQLVEKHYVIPKDFETNNIYGPLSGTCFEERAIGAYHEGMLQSKGPRDNNVGVEICSHCAVTGHTRDDCPELI
jgi:hypothetical protein